MKDWKTYSCDEVVQNGKHAKLQGKQLEWKNAATHVVKEISRSRKLEKLKPSDPVVLRIEERFVLGLWGATPRRRSRIPSFWTLRRRWESSGFRIPWQSRRSPRFSTLLLWLKAFFWPCQFFRTVGLWSRRSLNPGSISGDHGFPKLQQHLISLWQDH